MKYLYAQLNDFELIELLNKKSNLTFGAKLSLKKEIEVRNIMIEEAIRKELQEEIQIEERKISNLDYLEKMGFNYKSVNDGLVIERSKTAKNSDLFRIVFGGLLAILMFFALVDIISDLFLLDKQLDLLSTILVILFGIVLFFGLKVLYNAWNDYFNYLDFGFTLGNQSVSVKTNKRDEDVRFISISDLTLIEIDKSVVLRAGGIDLIKAPKENLHAIKTLESIISRSKSGIVFQNSI